MRIISFAETTEALLAGAKTVTRREWSHKYARTFTAGEILQAWDKNPRTKQGQRVATIRLTEAPELQPAQAIPPSHWRDEGFEYMTEHGLTLFGGQTPAQVFNHWKNQPVAETLWVVRFELVGVLTSVEQFRERRAAEEQRRLEAKQNRSPVARPRIAG